MTARISERSFDPFVGRTTELELLTAAARAAAQGRPVVVWIEGAAGSGKTTLVKRALAGLPEGCVTTSVPGDELAKDIAYDLARRLGVHGADNGFAVGQDLLGIWAQGQEDGVVVVVVEDAHWADDESLQAMLSAVRRLEEDRVLVIITSREPASEGWQRLMRDDDGCFGLSLGAFGTDDVATLAALHGVELTSRAATRLTMHTGGHPLWVHTLLNELTPSELQTPGDLPAPRSLASAVTARLGGVTEPARDLVAALAVIHQEATLPVLAAVTGNDEPLEALEALLSTGFVRWDPGETAATVTFTHPLYRQAVYQDLAPTRRRDLHRKAAEVLGPPSSLAHRVAAADGVDEALADELEAAAAQRGVGERALAGRELLWASSVTGDPSRAARLLVEAGRIFLDCDQPHRAAALKAKIEDSPDSPERDLVLGLIDWSQGNAADAEQRLLRSLGHPMTSDPTAARAWGELAEMYVTSGRAADAIDAADRALHLATRDTIAERASWCTGSLAEGMMYGGPIGLNRMNRRLPLDPAAVTDRDVSLLAIRATLHHYSFQPTQTLADLQAVLHLNERRSNPFQVPRCHFLMAASLTRIGDWDTALVHARTALSVADDEQLVWQLAQSHAYLAMLLAYTGNWGPAEEHVTRAFECGVAHNNLEGRGVSRALPRARLARSRNDPSGVIEHLGTMAAQPPLYVSMQYWPSLIDAYIDVGQLDQARTVLERMVDDAARRHLDLGSQVLPLRARLAAADGDAQSATALFADAVKDAEPDDPYLDRALVHQHYGQLLLRLGRRREGAEQLQAARGMLASVGAAPFVERVDRDLAESGTSSPAGPHGWSRGLTEREQDVATLVAQGLSNPEVAAQLYVSRKAVEYHLRNIFDKLGISSRRELQRDRLPV